MSVFLLFNYAQCFAGSETLINSPSQSKKTIAKLYHTLQNNPKFDMAERLEIISASFLNKPYLLGALGEGNDARYDQSPLYRTDGFDCDTLVNTVLAIALAANQQVFPFCLRNLRYKNGEVDFISRNHFTSLDWNLNNQKQGYLQDITQSFKTDNNQPVAKIASAVIDKPSWYEHFDLTHIKLNNADKIEQQKRMDELKKRASHLPVLKAEIPYIPLNKLFDELGNANQALFSQIPNAAIVEIVRPNWDLRAQIGTCLNISHLGFVFWKNNTLFFRQASSNFQKVIDVSLIDYLKDARSSPTIKGINIQIVVPKKPLQADCTV